MAFLHCRNNKCVNYWEDSCTKNLENKVVAINEIGECEDFQEGVSSYYAESEKSLLDSQEGLYPESEGE